MDSTIRWHPYPSRQIPTSDSFKEGGDPRASHRRGAGPDNSSSIVFRRGQGQEWELLNGVQFEGRSRANHEMDIALVPESVARTLRSFPGGGHPQGRPRVSIECKDVGENGRVDEMRAFIARLYDLTYLSAHHRYLNVSGPPRAIHPSAPSGSIHRPALTYWIENRRTLNVLVRRTGFQKGTAALSGYHAVHPYRGVTPGSASSTQLMDDIADWIYRKKY